MFDSEHFSGEFRKSVKRAELLMSYGVSFSDACHKLAEERSREFAYFACVAARMTLINKVADGEESG